MRENYTPPFDIHEATLADLLKGTDRVESTATASLFQQARNSGPSVYYAGDPAILALPSVAIVGTRNISDAGVSRARRMTRELVDAGVVIVSGLARGVDAVAHATALASGGRTIAVLGTPLDQASPRANASIQEAIWRDHLLISQFPIGSRVYRTNFPKRNKTMAMVSDGTIIVEASDTSGTLHQAVECTRLGRWLFLLRSVVDDRSLEWPSKFKDYEKTVIVTSVTDVLEKITRA